MEIRPKWCDKRSLGARVQIDGIQSFGQAGEYRKADAQYSYRYMQYTTLYVNKW